MERDKFTNLRDLVAEGMSAATTPDRLTAVYLELSGRCFRLAEETGKAHRAYLDAERVRKAAHVAKKLHYMLDSVPIGRAEASAEHDTGPERKAEVDAQAAYIELREVHRAAQDVMSAIQMRISWLKAEYQQSGRQS